MTDYAVGTYIDCSCPRHLRAGQPYRTGSWGADYPSSRRLPPALHVGLRVYHREDCPMAHGMRTSGDQRVNFREIA